MKISLKDLLLILFIFLFFNQASPALGIEEEVVAGGPVVGIISRPTLKPRAVAVYNKGNKVFVADDATGNVYMYDGTTLAELGSVFVGKGVTTMVVHEGSGKLYAASLFECKIGVVDAANGIFIRYLARENADIWNRGYCNMFKGHLAIDDNLGKVYALSLQGLTQIDISTDSETHIHQCVGFFEDCGFGGGGYEGMGINPVTHEVFVVRYIQGVLVIVDGITLKETMIPGLRGAGQIVGVNWKNNKAYVGYCGNHSDGRAAMCIYDRATNSITFAGSPNDAVNLFYNSESNRIYSTVEIDRVATIIDGVTSASANLPMPGPRDAVGFRFSTRHVYYVGLQDIYVLRESDNLLPEVVTVINVNNKKPSSVVKQDIAINQNTGRIYIINDTDALNFVTVVQDIPTDSNYTVTPLVGSGGTVSPNTAQTVTAGATKSFTVTSNSGYTRSSTVGGTCPQGSWSGNTWTTGAINAHCAVSFGFTADSSNTNPVIGSSFNSSTKYTHNSLGQLVGATTTINVSVSDPDGDSVSCIWEGNDYIYIGGGFVSYPANISGDCNVAIFSRRISFGQPSQSDITLKANDGKGGTSSLKIKFQ